MPVQETCMAIYGGIGDRELPDALLLINCFIYLGPQPQPLLAKTHPRWCHE